MNQTQELTYRGGTLDRDEDKIRLNFERTKELDKLIRRGYDKWVKEAPTRWKEDDFLKKHEPIVVTSRYGQNAAIAVDEEAESESWSTERDFTKIEYLTFALATSIE